MKDVSDRPCTEHDGGEHFFIFEKPTGKYCWCGARQ